jgi:hypothetical protein
VPSTPAEVFCPVGFTFAEVEVHQREPVDQDLAVWVCVPNEEASIAPPGTR